MPYLFTTDYTTTSYDTGDISNNFFRVVLERYVMSCRKVAYVSGGAACIGAGVFIVLVMTMSRLRLERFIESGTQQLPTSTSLLWHYTGFFRVFGFYVFMICNLVASIITYIPAALALIGGPKTPAVVLGTIVVMIGVQISFLSLWRLCKKLMKELWVLAMTAARPLWRVRRTGSMGV
ncbi:hypothetical protein BDQ17DRAFT_1349993 [Cyathus striatus]|nr:hypothetical protein BDQ17DRAFT_1349993 [Cyathus striatus]